MKQVEVCKNDGYLAGGGCETELRWVPKNSHFEKVSAFTGGCISTKPGEHASTVRARHQDA